MAKAPINVTISGDYNDRDIKRAIRDLQSLRMDAGQTTQTMGLTGKAGVALGAAIAAGAATAGYAIVKFGKDSIMAASDFEEVQNKVQEVFGPAGRQVLNDFAETADTAMGLSRTAFLDASSQFGIFGRAAGLAGRDLVTFSSDLTQLSGDLASFNNTTVDEAIQALGAGLRGESEPLRRFGILLDDATLKARAMELGIYDGTGSLTQQQRVLAAQAEILGQTNVQQGDFARTAGGLANTMRTLSAAVENAQIEIGKGFVAAIQQVSSDMGGPSGLAARIEDVGRQISNMTRGVGFLVGKFQELTDESEGAYNPLQSLVRIFQAIEAASPIQGIVRLAGQIGILGDATRDYIAEGSAMEAALRAQSALLRARSRDEQVNLDGLSAATDRYTGLSQSLGAEIGFGTLGLQRYNVYLEEIKERTKGAGTAAKDSAKGFGELRKELLASLEESPAERYAAIIEQLKGNLKSAEDTFTRFKDSVISSITQAFSFGDAYQAAKESGITFLDALQQQAGRAVMFAEVIKQLVIDGLKPEAIQQVLAAGVEAGTKIGVDLINGGATAIAQTNALVDQSIAAANEVAELAASSYFGAGVKSAQDTLDGFAAQLGPDGPSNKRMQRIMDSLAASLRRETTITVTTVHRNVYESVGLPGRAMGGPVTADQAYVVGERGPEVFVPDVAGTIVPNHAVMSPARGGIGGGGINLTVNAGMGTDGAQVGRQIVDALKAYERRNGAVYVSA